MLINRRGFHRWAVLAGAGLLSGGVGCSLLPPEPVPMVPFGDFSVTVTGGIAGIYRELRVTADGTGLVLSTEPAAGRIGQETMDRLRTLLESSDLRRDIARLRSDPRQPRCSDAFLSTLRMGELVATRTDTCADVATPTLDELGRILQPFWDGRFEAPLPDDPPLPRVVVQKISAGKPTRERIEIDPSGTATLIIGERRDRTAQIPAERLDALRQLISLPRCVPERATPDEAYQVQVGDQAPAPATGRWIGPVCPEHAAIVHLALDAVDR